jgi:hypothetical protein
VQALGGKPGTDAALESQTDQLTGSRELLAILVSNGVENKPQSNESSSGWRFHPV